MRCIFHENFRITSIDSVIVSEREIQVDKEELNRTKLTVNVGWKQKYYNIPVCSEFSAFPRIKAA